MKTLPMTCLTLCLLLLTATAWAGDVIESGADLWRTPADGNTYYDFGKDPIPAGFFCTGSAAFTQRVVFQGMPLATSPPNALGGIDTVIHRLDDATFNRQGRAVTRVRPAAISLVASAPVRTSCGNFGIEASLHGRQPTAEMVIVKEGPHGGYFHSALSLNLRLDFRPESGHGKTLSLVRRVDFPFSTKIPWANAPGEGGVVSKGLVSVDSNGDGVANKFLPATSNFAAGWSVPAQGSKALVPVDEFCHAGYGGGDQHCYYP
ncbi:MAG: hypothetical protein GY719_34270 [bacterium]|nr:hypothetical protein [bacterium]